MRAGARLILKSLCILPAVLACALAQAEARWLTLSGDPQDPVVHTVEVDPTITKADAQTRKLQIRVNLPQPAQDLAPEPYRSFEATITLDCTSNTAHYDRLRLYTQPDWQGSARDAAPPDDAALRVVQFPDAETDPTPRIIRAACLS